MERKLLGVYESEKGIGRVYTGPMTDTEEKRKELFTKAMLSFAKDIRRSDPQKFYQITKPVPKDK